MAAFMVTEYTSDPTPKPMAETQAAEPAPSVTAEPKEVATVAAPEEEEKKGGPPQRQDEEKVPIETAPAEGALPTPLEKVETNMDVSPEKPKPTPSESSADESPAPSLSSEEAGSAISLSPVPSPTEPNPSQDE